VRQGQGEGATGNTKHRAGVDGFELANTGTRRPGCGAGTKYGVVVRSRGKGLSSRRRVWSLMRPEASPGRGVDWPHQAGLSAPLFRVSGASGCVLRKKGTSVGSVGSSLTRCRGCVAALKKHGSANRAARHLIGVWKERNSWREEQQKQRWAPPATIELTERVGAREAVPGEPGRALQPSHGASNQPQAPANRCLSLCRNWVALWPGVSKTCRGPWQGPSCPRQFRVGLRAWNSQARPIFPGLRQSHEIHEPAEEQERGTGWLPIACPSSSRVQTWICTPSPMPRILDPSQTRCVASGTTVIDLVIANRKHSAMRVF
jgi:hypothetical protein